MICADALPIGDNPMLMFGAAGCVDEAFGGRMANERVVGQLVVD